MSWVLDAIGAERVDRAEVEASRRRVVAALGFEAVELGNEEELREAGAALEILVFDLLTDDEQPDALRQASARAFQVCRAIQLPPDPVEAAEWLLRLACMAILGDRGADIHRVLVDDGIPDLPLTDDDWGHRVWAVTLNIWLRVVRKHGWEDLDRIQEYVAVLREQQGAHEPTFLAGLEDSGSQGPAWRLIAEYHLAKTVEVLGIFVGQGTGPDGRYDVHQQLEAQFDRALGACARGGLVDLEVLVRLLARAAAGGREQQHLDRDPCREQSSQPICPEHRLSRTQSADLRNATASTAHVARKRVVGLGTSVGGSQPPNVQRQDDDSRVPDAPGAESVRSGARLGGLHCSDPGAGEADHRSPAARLRTSGNRCRTGKPGAGNRRDRGRDADR